MEEDIEIIWAYSPLMVPQRSPSPELPIARTHSPFNMKGQIIDLTLDEDDAGTTEVSSDRNPKIDQFPPLKSSKVISCTQVKGV